MNFDTPEHMLHIRCPSCAQRFKVGDELMNRTVECGGCEHRFLIEDEVILRGRKYYPGQRKPTDLQNIRRIDTTPGMAVGQPVQQVAYAEPPNPIQYEPTPPVRIIAACCGVFILAVTLLVLILGAGRNFLFSDVPVDKLLIMTGFCALSGSGLLIYGNPKTRGKAAVVSILTTAMLLSLPPVFWEGMNPGQKPADDAGESNAPKNPPEEMTLSERIGTEPLEREIVRLAIQGSQETAVGLWLKNLIPSHRFLVRDFVIRTLNANYQTHYFERDDPLTKEPGDLLVVSGTKVEFGKISNLMSPLGQVTGEYPDLAVIEIEVDNSNFVEGPVDKLSNRLDPAFYQLNKRELESIDLARIEKAVRRLIEAEPQIYRADIRSRMIDLLQADYVEFKGDIAKALRTWGTDSPEEGEAGLIGLEQLLAKQKPVPNELVELTIRTKNWKSLPHLDKLWQESTLDWEYTYMQAGEPAEPFVLPHLETDEGRQLQSAIRILGKVGTTTSIPALESFLNNPNVEIRLLVEKSIEAIHNRQTEH